MAAFASFAGVEKSAFTYLSGEEKLGFYASSDTHQRVFCKNCGSNILVELDAEPDDYYVSMGSVDGKPNLPEGYHIFVGSKAAWYEFNDSQVRYETVPEEE